MERAGFMTCTAASPQGAIHEPAASLKITFQDDWHTQYTHTNIQMFGVSKNL